MPYYPELGVYLPGGPPRYLRPLRVDTLDIDVSKPRRLQLSHLQQGPLRRGRSVVRIRTMRRAPRPSPGALLVQKFIIPEKKPPPAHQLSFERPAITTRAHQAVFSTTSRQGSSQVREGNRGSVNGVKEEGDRANRSSSEGDCEKIVPEESGNQPRRVEASRDRENLIEKVSVESSTKPGEHDPNVKQDSDTVRKEFTTKSADAEYDKNLIFTDESNTLDNNKVCVKEESKEDIQDQNKEEITPTEVLVSESQNDKEYSVNEGQTVGTVSINDCEKLTKLETKSKPKETKGKNKQKGKLGVKKNKLKQEENKNTDIDSSKVEHVKNGNKSDINSSSSVPKSIDKEGIHSSECSDKYSVYANGLNEEKRLETESLINKSNLESEARTLGVLANNTAGPNDNSSKFVSEKLISTASAGQCVVPVAEPLSQPPHSDSNSLNDNEGPLTKGSDEKLNTREEDIFPSCDVKVRITECESNECGKQKLLDKNNNSSFLTSDEEGYCSETELSIEEEDMETGVKKKKKVIVKKKNGKVKMTPLEAKPPTGKKYEDTATAGEIKRQNSKKRLSLVDDQLGLIEERKTSISDEVIAEEAAYLDSMILETMKATLGRRKSSLAFPPLLPEIVEEESGKRPSKIVEEAVVEPVSTKDTRREQWHKAAAGGRAGSKTLGKFFRGKVKKEDESSEEEECDVNCHWKCRTLMPNLCGVNQKLIAEALASVKRGRSVKESSQSPCTSTSVLNSSDSTESSESGTGQEAGRVTPPATTLPRFREYAITDFQFLKVLGKGSFGKVLLAELSGSGCYYAVKALKKDVVLEDDDVECTMIERKVLTLGTGHPYFCHLFCTFQTESHLFFVMEYLNGGDLMFHIQESGRFDEGRARFYAAEIVSGLKFLHKWGIVYRDLKLDNVLLDFEGHVRIADFGMCKLQIYLDKTTDTFCGTPDYMAPEIIKGLRYNQCVDWWSFGVLLYEMVVGQSPFSGCDEDDLFWSVCNEQPHMPRYLSNSAKSILLALMEKDWTKRLGYGQNGAQDVMGHGFFDGLSWGLLERRELKPPYKPTVRHPLDTKYFDKAFTQEKPKLTPVDRRILESMDQSQFEGFSYTNPNATE